VEFGWMWWCVGALDSCAMLCCALLCCAGVSASLGGLVTGQQGELESLTASRVFRGCLSYASLSFPVYDVITKDTVGGQVAKRHCSTQRPITTR
jgi:hypothetical protein